MKKQPHEFRQGDPIVILDGFENKPRPCKVKRVEANGAIIGEDERGLRWFSPGNRTDRYIVPDLFHPIMPWERP